MCKLMAGAVALMLVLGLSVAQAKNHKGGGSSGGGCTQQWFQRCMDKCQAHGGPSKSSAVIKKMCEPLRQELLSGGDAVSRSALLPCLRRCMIAA